MNGVQLYNFPQSYIIVMAYIYMSVSAVVLLLESIHVIVTFGEYTRYKV